MSSYARRFPVYLVLDCSESMAGDAFAAMREGLRKLVDELRKDPMALDMAALSVITFASRAQQLMPLTDLVAFTLPSLKLGSGTALGAALELLEQAIAREVRKTTAEQKGDYKPVVFLLTDGDPTDGWEQAADRLKSKVVGRSANFVAVGCGPDANLDVLRRITPTVVAMKSVDSVSFSEFFKWVSASVSTASLGLSGAGEQGIRLPDLPQEHLEVTNPGEQRSAPVPDRHVFLHARCVKDGRFYIMRFAKQETGGGLLRRGQTTYKGVAAHMVEDLDAEGAGAQAGPSVQASRLDEPPPCPYCGNAIWAMCDCGKVHCAPMVKGKITLTCPWCKASGEYALGDFSVGRGTG